MLKNLFLTSFMLLTAVSTPEKKDNSPTTYGHIAVSQVVEVCEDYTICCDIESWPAIIGSEIPVRIDNIQQPFALPPEQKQIEEFMQSQIRRFIETRIEQASEILLMEIKRDRQFRILAQVQVDGNDLAEMLIEAGLAQEGPPIKLVYEQPEPKEKESESKAVETAPPTPGKPVTQQAKSPARAQRRPDRTKQESKEFEFIASKNSRIFHRPGCRFVGTISQANQVTFRDREEAINTGRRPCKTCNP